MEYVLNGQQKLRNALQEKELQTQNTKRKTNKCNLPGEGRVSFVAVVVNTSDPRKAVLQVQ